jgi:CheY-like chemotaxis protein
MAVRVLVVDDTDHVRSMLCDMLRLDGFNVVAAVGAGAEAAPAVEEHRPDVVIMDLRMPGVDGLEATRRVKAVRPEQVVILYTAYLDPVVEAQAKEAGVSVCLGKVEGIPELERELSRLAMELTPDS